MFSESQISLHPNEKRKIRTKFPPSPSSSSQTTRTLILKIPQAQTLKTLMATASLIKTTCFFKDPPKTRPFIFSPLKFNPLLHTSPQFSFPSIKNPNKFIKLSAKSPLKPSNQVPNQNPFAEFVIQTLESLKKPAVALILIGALLTFNPYSALAASGGRMGGRSFSSSSSTKSYSHSGPSSSFSYSVPYYAPSPFGSAGGFYAGPAFGVGFGAGSGVFLLMMGFTAVILVSGFLSDRSEDGSILTATEKTTVLKLQVGLLGMARSLQKDLDRIAENADTSTSEGLHYVLTETVLALLRQPDCCISAYSSVDVKRSIEEGEKRFNQLSIEERGKFDEETLVNVNNIKRQRTSSQRPNSFSNEYIVITILVAAEGVHKVPVINGSADLKEALQKLASIPSSKTLAVEVLWTPQNEDDTLLERELLEDYPLLRPL